MLETRYGLKCLYTAAFRNLVRESGVKLERLPPGVQI